MRTRLVDAEVYYGWVIVGCCFAASTVMFGLTYSFGVFFTPLLSAFPVSNAELSLAFGLQTFVIYVGSIFAGGITDRFGVRRVLLAGGLLIGGGLLATAATRSYWGLLFWYGLVVGIGMSAVYVVAYTTVPQWFGRRRGIANGVASSGLGVGLLVVAPVAAELIAAHGWRVAYAVLAAGAGGILLPAAWLLADDPRAIDEPVGEEFPDGGRSQEPVELGGRLGRVGETVRSIPFVALVTGWTLVYGTLYVLINHLVRYTRVAGVPDGVGVLAISTIGVATSLARIGVGFASDRVGRPSAFLVSAALMAATTALFSVARTKIAVLGLAAAFGVGYGGVGGLLSPLVADLFGTDDLGSLYGIASVSFAIAGLLAPPLAGLGVDRLGAYAPVFLGTGVVGALGTGAVAIAVIGRDRDIPTSG